MLMEEGQLDLDIEMGTVLCDQLPMNPDQILNREQPTWYLVEGIIPSNRGPVPLEVENTRIPPEEELDMEGP